MKLHKVVVPGLALLFGVVAAFLVFNLTEAKGRKHEASADRTLQYPETRRVMQVDEYHGVKVPDPFRWLEETESAESKRWIKAQDDLTTGFVRKWQGYDAVRKRILQMQIFDSYSLPIQAGSWRFLTITPAGKSDPSLYGQNIKGGEPQQIIDGDVHFAGTDVRIASFMPSPDGKFVAYQLRAGQSAWRTLRIFDMEQRQDLPDLLVDLHGWTSAINWTGDNAGFYYQKFDRVKSIEGQDDKLQNASIRYHRLGTRQSQDTEIYTRADKPNWLFTPSLTLDQRYLVVTEAEGGSTENTVVYQDRSAPDGDFITLVGTPTATYTFIGSQGSTFWFMTDSQAPARRVVSIDVSQDNPQWLEVIPEREETLQAVRAVDDYFVGNYVQDAKPLLKLYRQSGRFLRTIDLPDIGGVGGIGRWQLEDQEFYYSFGGLYDPGSIYRLDIKTGESVLLYRSRLSFSPEDYETRQVFYHGKDGAKIPMFVAHKRDLHLDGKQPLFMYGYGAWGWSAFPWFQAHILAWMELGGVYALPGIRGGGEYGESWHQAGIKLNKQTGVDDYIAAAEWLIENHYTSKKRIVANGGSASGVMAGAAIVQRPDLFGASIIDIPSLDLIRFVESPGGRYLTPEYGDPADAREFAALLSLSPYHNLREDICYPATLVMVGDRDQTAIPMHGYKFIARMQEVQECDNPVLLKVMWGAGHNYGTTPEQRAESWADAWGFLFRTLDLPEPGKS